MIWNLLRVLSLSGVDKIIFLQGWPSEEPDIIVSTPAAILNYLYAIDPDRRRRSNFMRGVKYVVSLIVLCGTGSLLVLTSST